MAGIYPYTEEEYTAEQEKWAKRRERIAKGLKSIPEVLLGAGRFLGGVEGGFMNMPSRAESLAELSDLRQRGLLPPVSEPGRGGPMDPRGVLLDEYQGPLLDPRTGAPRYQLGAPEPEPEEEAKPRAAAVPAEALAAAAAPQDAAATPQAPWAALEERLMKGLEETAPERPAALSKGEQLSRMLLGAVSGAAQMGQGGQVNVGQILAGAGAGGLGGIMEMQEQQKQLMRDYHKERRQGLRWEVAARTNLENTKLGYANLQAKQRIAQVDLAFKMADLERKRARDNAQVARWSQQNNLSVARQLESQVNAAIAARELSLGGEPGVQNLMATFNTFLEMGNSTAALAYGGAAAVEFGLAPEIRSRFNDQAIEIINDRHPGLAQEDPKQFDLMVNQERIRLIVNEIGRDPALGRALSTSMFGQPEVEDMESQLPLLR